VHGRCINLGGTKFKCDCSLGYVGQYCDTRECLSIIQTDINTNGDDDDDDDDGDNNGIIMGTIQVITMLTIISKLKIIMKMIMMMMTMVVITMAL